MDPATTERIKREIEFEFAREGPPDGFPKFPDIPAGRYVSAEFFELEREHIWSRTSHTTCSPTSSCRSSRSASRCCSSGRSTFERPASTCSGLARIPDALRVAPLLELYLERLEH
jgi:hypothetical protein